MRDLKTPKSPAALSYEAASTARHIARWWEPEPSDKVHCYLCPRHCHIGPGQAGFCFIRANDGGKLYSLGYAHPAALQIDPIEKKPLHHFLPGTKVFSMGTAGCNMGCFFCQNWDISKSRSDQVHSTYMPPEDVVQLAIHHGCPSIAFTYNEPTIWGEYVIDICQAAKEYGIRTVMVSNGYVTREAFHDIYDHVDAANIDLKAFTENFYGRTTLTHLQPVLDTLKWLKNETNVWVEITNLLIPTLNDAPAETRALSEWILENLGPDVPLHFTAFHPDFKLRDKPRTPAETLHAARAIALEVGLHYVYEGNIRSDGAHTSCPSCKSLLIRRSWHDVEENRLVTGRVPHESPMDHAHWNDAHAESNSSRLSAESPLRSSHSPGQAAGFDNPLSPVELHSRARNPQKSSPDLDGYPLIKDRQSSQAGSAGSSSNFDCRHLPDRSPLRMGHLQNSSSQFDSGTSLGEQPTHPANSQYASSRYQEPSQSHASCPDCGLTIPGRWSVAFPSAQRTHIGSSPANGNVSDNILARDNPSCTSDGHCPQANQDKASAAALTSRYGHLQI